MSISVPRALNVSTNPAGWLAAAGAVLAAAVMITNAVHHHGVIDPTVVVAAIGAVGALLTRQVVTPVADPKNGAGVPLAPAPGGVITVLPTDGESVAPAPVPPAV